MTTFRVLSLLLAALLCTAAPAGAFSFEERRLTAPSVGTSAAAVPAPHPLTGEGENLEIVANLPIDPGSAGVAASDIELHGDYAFIGSYGEGMVIADISDPTRPKRAGTFRCGGGSQYDVQLNDDATIAVLSTDGKNATCFPRSATGATQEGSMIIDISDKANPVLAAAIPIQVGSHTQTLDGDTLYINNYPTSYSKLEIFDLSNPYTPAKRSELKFPGSQSSIHDSFVDHRPDGRDLLYAASIGYTDVIDVTDVDKPVLLQRLADPTVSISHQAEPNHKRDVLLVTDEYNGGGDASYCGKTSVQDPTGLLQGTLGPELTDTGALHFYKLAADGTMVNNGTGAGKIGTWNLPFQTNDTAGCTSHVLWQAPDENRFTAAWYAKGVRVVDFADPANASEKGWFIPTGADTWAAKPHRGYIFTGDIARGMDVLKYTGEEGKRWPATAGPQEEQRAAYRVDTAPSAKRKAAKRTTTVTLTDRSGAIAAKLRFTGKPRGLARQLKGLGGRYRYTVRAGDSGRVLKRGTLTVPKRDGVRLAIGADLVCRII